MEKIEATIKACSDVIIGNSKITWWTRYNNVFNSFLILETTLLHFRLTKENYFT